MKEISVVMSAYNAEKWIASSIESVLKQSFTDFEFIIVDDGSTDNTQNIIKSYNDPRINVIINEHDFIGSLNIGMNAASGEYIARMDADDIMHTDRLRISHAILKNNPEITVCSSWMYTFGKDTDKNIVNRTGEGIVCSPLVQLLKSNIFFNSTSIMRRDFIVKNKLEYKRYDYAEDYKWWADMAETGASFYVEPQPLVYYRLSDNQVSRRYRFTQYASSVKIRHEILSYLININKNYNTELLHMYKAMNLLVNTKLIQVDDMFQFFSQLFDINKHDLITEVGSIQNY